MVYSVELSNEAIANLRDIRRFIHAASSDAAKKWYAALRERIRSLHELPQRGRATPEDPKLQELLFGNKPHIYRIIYSIDELTKRVFVLHIRHGARQPFQLSDIPPMQ